MGRIGIVRLSILLFLGFGVSAELYDDASWNWAVKIAVIDCSDPVNRDISTEYNVEFFPTFIFFLKGGKHQVVPKYFSNITFREKIADILVNEKQWDRLVPVMNISDAITVFGPNAVQVAMIILDTQLNIPTTLQSVIVEGSQYGVKDVLGNIIFTSEDVDAVKKFLLDKYQKVELKVSQQQNRPITTTPKVVTNPIPHSLPVYAADIVASLQNLLNHDIALKKEIKGVELAALKEFLAVLSKYLDLGPQYNEEIDYLQKSVAGQSVISREDWTVLVAKLKACSANNDKAPIAHALNRFVPHFFSCGYCGFHFAKMTSNVRLPGEAIYPDRPTIVTPFPLEEPDPSTLPVAPKSARDEVLWLNIAHNVVNKRLSVNVEMPKEFCLNIVFASIQIQVFPSPQQCRVCWSDEARAKIAEDKFAALPDKTEELLAYLVHHYRPSSWRWDNVYVSFEDISQ
ncbi:unnamed protein product [Rodentolepis nana]|uniref:Sulfhydryl oxidase n=1 Tax=Rodentolepis nana TaxID=102285 RepID=A0A0R3TKG9_RODNA|nr:unnamed protein product [Rodentolepis nana]